MLDVPTPGMEAVTRDMAPIPGSLKYPVTVVLFIECQDKGASSFPYVSNRGRVCVTV